MNRRTVISMLGAAAVWPQSARAQQSTVPMIGFLHTANAEANSHLVTAFREGLAETGYIDGTSVAIETHWADGRYERLPAMIASLIQRRASIIVAGGSTAPAYAAKAATSTIPIVFVSGDDPVKGGLVASLNRPGGNLTGVVFFNSVLVAKRIELLRELLPSAKSIAYLFNPSRPEAESEAKDVRDASQVYAFSLHLLPVTNEATLDTAFGSLRPLQVGAALMAADPFLGGRRYQVAALAARHSIAVIGTTRDYVASGCLASYGTSIPDAYRQAGTYAGRILKGAKPADLPVWQPTKFELVINLKTAKALGLEIPTTLLARADEVIE